MSDELLPYYNRELAFFRDMGKEFAKANPKIAGRLRIGPDSVEDPHVSRMIEAFAYLNARTRHKLEDDFPELTDSMLGVLYPHYLAPIPSMAIVQFKLDRGQADLVDGYRIERESQLETEPAHSKGVDGQPCRFRTCYDTTLYPVEVVSAAIKGQPFEAPHTGRWPDAAAVLHVQLQTYSPEAPFSALNLSTLRFFLRGQSQLTYDLYEAMLNDTLGVAVASSAKDDSPTLLGPEQLRAVGFSRDEAVLEYPARSFSGYRIVTEYFAFPEKYLFVDLEGLGNFQNNGPLREMGQTVELFFFLSRYSQDLERNVSAETLALGCTPIVNLYKQRAEPIRLTHTQSEYRVAPDSRRPLGHEIYSIDSVSASSSEGEEMTYAPFYSIKHSEDRESPAFWAAERRSAGYADGEIDNGTEVLLSFVDLSFDPTAQANWVADVETTCLNRDLPHQLPFGGGQPRLELDGAAPLASIECVTPPTRTLRPTLGRGARWRIISHLSLNHISLADFENGADGLREILKLYDFVDSAETRGVIDGIRSLNSKRTVSRVGGAVSAGLCRGVEITIDIDEDRFSGGGVFLFASVLDRFLGLYASINSFTQTVVSSSRREGVLRRWPPRAGEKVLV